MGYRPITDMWILTRPKVKYYGAYPSGFLERARALMGVNVDSYVLHVCSGKVRDYPYPKRALGRHDFTLDIDPDLHPDFVMDVRRLGKQQGDIYPHPTMGVVDLPVAYDNWHYNAILIDRPYSEQDAENYACGSSVLPDINDLLKRSLSIVEPGGRVGVLDYVFPRPPKKVDGMDIKLVACVGVVVGYGNRIRIFSVFEKVAEV